MTADTLNGEYQSLRAELDDAYAEAEWDSARIDRITARMAPLERALSAWRLPLQTAQDGASTAA